MLNPLRLVANLKSIINTISNLRQVQVNLSLKYLLKMSITALKVVWKENLCCRVGCWARVFPPDVYHQMLEVDVFPVGTLGSQDKDLLSL